MKTTIVLPLYNSEMYIEETIKSLLCQSFDDFELLIVNDCSTDCSISLINRFDDKRIKVINQDVNKGASFSRNLGISLAEGDYIAYADSDDVYEKDWLKQSVEYLEKNDDIDAVCSWINIINGKGKKIGHWHPPTSFDEIKANILFESVFANPTFVGRSRFVKEIRFNENLKFCEDLDVYLNAIFSGRKIINISNVNCNYRINDNGLTQNSKKNVSKLNSIRQNIYERNFSRSEIFNMDLYDEKKHQLVVDGCSISPEQYHDLAKYVKNFYLGCDNEYCDVKSRMKKVSNLVTYLYLRAEFSSGSCLCYFFDDFRLDFYNVKNRMKKIVKLLL